MMKEKFYDIDAIKKIPSLTIRWNKLVVFILGKFIKASRIFGEKGLVYSVGHRKMLHLGRFQPYPELLD
jgi:hypothetical protein